MTCRKCNYEFCWICLKDWKLHINGNYNCNRYNENDSKDLKHQGRAAVERYLHYYNRFINHQNSLKLEDKVIDFWFICFNFVLIINFYVYKLVQKLFLSSIMIYITSLNRSKIDFWVIMCQKLVKAAIFELNNRYFIFLRPKICSIFYFLAQRRSSETDEISPRPRIFFHRDMLYVRSREST